MEWKQEKNKVPNLDFQFLITGKERELSFTLFLDLSKNEKREGEEFFSSLEVYDTEA